jgi:uncharacterized SAM-binding protein YcdF (DUF218 family)
MFYVASKAFWLLASPSTFLPFIAAGSLSLALFRRSVTSVALVVFCTTCFIASIVLPVGIWLSLPLEKSFPMPTIVGLPTGIIALGGEYGDRIAALAKLSREFPSAIVVYSGRVDDQLKKRFVESGGVVSRLVIETESRNTDENARYVAALFKPTPTQHWILITSALHMPRAIGCFRHAGFRVQAYPVSFLTNDAAPRSWGPRGLRTLDLSAKEWLGLFVYRMFGKTNEIWPSVESP